MKARDLVHADGAGNRFALLDGLRHAAPADPARAAREICGQTGLDGLLLLLAGAGEAAARMVLYNADGSRPEACGNGLRCVALAACRHGHVPFGEFVVDTDAGPRRVRVHAAEPDVEVEIGPVRPAAREQSLRVRGRSLSGWAVHAGNPHFVIRSDELDDPAWNELGPLVTRHPAFENGTNFELVALSEADLRARVFERGVGETRACGSGAAAAAVVAATHWQLDWPIAVVMPGGRLEIERDAQGRIWLRGPAELSAFEWDIPLSQTPATP